MENPPKHRPWWIAIVGGTVATIVGTIIATWLLSDDGKHRMRDALQWVRDIAARSIGFSAPIWAYIVALVIALALGRVISRNRVIVSRIRAFWDRRGVRQDRELTERVGVLFRKSADAASQQLQIVISNIGNHLRASADANDTLPHSFATLLLDTSAGLRGATERLRRATGGESGHNIEEDLLWFYEQYVERVRWMRDAAQARGYDLQADPTFRQWTQFDSAFLSELHDISAHINSRRLHPGVLYNSGVPGGRRDYAQYAVKPAPAVAPAVAPAAPPALNGLQKRIMAFYAKQPSAKHNAVTLGPWVRDTELHVDNALETLESAGLLRKDHNILSGTGYVLTPEGKQYLLDQGH